MNTIGYLEARSKIQALLGQSDLDLADVKEVIGRIDVGDGTGKTTVLYSGKVTPDGLHTGHIAENLSKEFPSDVGFNHSGAGAFASYQDFFNGNWGYLDTGLTASQANALQGLNADGTEQDPNNYEYFWNQDEEWSGGPDGYYDYVDTTKAPTDGRGEVDASDPAYREFLLWQDANQDGIRDEGEGQTLTQIGVVAVRLNEATGLWEAHTSDNRVIPFYQKDLRFGSNGIREINMASGTLRLFENGGGEFYATTATDLGKYGYVSGGHNVAGAPTKIMVTADKLTSLPPASCCDLEWKQAA